MGKLRVRDPQGLIQFISNAVPLSDAIGRYIVLEKAGSVSRCCCPFHADNDPSFVVSDRKQIWKCFGSCSDKHGKDVIRFIQAYLGLTFIEAVEQFSVDFNIDIKDYLREPTIEEQWHDYLCGINGMAADVMHQMYLQNKKIVEYVTDVRQIPSQTQDDFNLGYTEHAHDLIVAMRSAGVDDITIDRLELTNDNLFGGRLIFPIHDAEGDIVFFRGRAMTPSKDKWAGTSRNSPVYPIASPLYGMHRARKHIRESGRLIAVEGFFDVMRMHSCNRLSTVGVMNVNLSPEQVMTAKQYGASRISLMWDGDAGGRKGLYNLVSQLSIDDGMILDIVTLPPGLDPDDVINTHGIASIDDKLNNATHFAQYYIEQSMLDTVVDNVLDVHMLINKVRSRVHTLSPLNKAIACKCISDAVGIDQQTITACVSSGIYDTSVLSDATSENKILSAMAGNEQIYAQCVSSLTEDCFYVFSNKFIFSAIVEERAKAGVPTAHVVHSNIVASGKGNLVSQTNVDAVFSASYEDWQSCLDIIIDRYKRRTLYEKMTGTMSMCIDASISSDEIVSKISGDVVAIAVRGSSDGDGEHNRIALVDRTTRFIINQVANPGTLPGFDLRPQFPALSLTLGGIRKQKYIVIGALPGQGKSALMLKIALVMALQGAPVLFVNMEMEDGDVMTRLYSMLIWIMFGQRVTINAMQYGYLTQLELDMVKDAAYAISQMPIFIETKYGASIQAVSAITHLYKLKYDISAVFIDYIQLLGSESHSSGELWAEYRDVSTGIKNMAGNLDIAAVCAAQLSASAIGMMDQKREFNPIGAEHVGGSKKIWADCDTFMIPQKKPEKIINEIGFKYGRHIINISKNRGGREGIVHAVWDGETTSWFEPSDGQPTLGGGMPSGSQESVEA